METLPSSKKDTDGKSAADVVQERFWLRFKHDPTKESETRECVGRCCDQLIGSIIYYARIYATIDHFRRVKRRIICDKIAGKFYLSKEEYIEQRPTWCKEECWTALAEEWSHPDFQKRSATNQANRYSKKFKPHKGGSNSIATIRQKLAKEKGREVSEVEAWVYTHRGSNPEALEALNTEEAAACLERYKAKVIELNGPEFGWLHSPVDIKALYECACGRQHGKIFNGIVDDRESLADLKSGHASSLSAKRRCQEEEERMRKEAHDSRSAKEYALNMLEWCKMVQMSYENIQKFMENVAVHTGMPATAVPPPMPPPPLPPTFGVSISPNQSMEHVGTFGSSVGIETPEETLSRIAQGRFGGLATTASGANRFGASHNGTASGGGNYSPPQDEFPMY